MGQVLVFAHRGASAEAPANSLGAVRRARALGADGVEVDLRRCASGEVVLFHDEDLSAYGRSDRVDALPLSALRRLDLGGGERVPTLDELFEEGKDLVLNLEIKAERVQTGGLERAVVAAVRRQNCAARVLLSSFNPISLLRAKMLAPEIRTAFLFHGGQSPAWRALWPRLLRPHALHPEQDLVDADFLRRARAGGYRIHAWTCDREHDIRRLAGLGVHGIITNRPEVARRVLDRGAP
jgi:glycerophosphoryl diester phosphodiesterase